MRKSVRAVLGFVAPSILVLSATALQAVFNPPMVVWRMRAEEGRVYFIDRGQDANIKVGVSLGHFSADAGVRGDPLIRMKTPVKGDLVIPELKIDSSVLYAPGVTKLQAQVVAEELEKDRALRRSPDEAANQDLSVRRAEKVRDYLVNNFEKITSDMISAAGYGESRPLVRNDAPVYRAPKRRIEVIVWD